MTRKLVKSLGFLAVLAGGVLISGLGTTALASTTTSIPVAVTGGSLTLQAPSSPSSFGSLVLNGQVQTVTSGLSPWKVIDATGTGYGWSVSLSASPLTEETPPNGFASGTSALTLPSGSMSITDGGVITAGVGSTPVSTSGGPTFENLDSPLTASPFVLLKSDNDYGLGTYTITPSSSALSLTLNPATTEVDSVNYPSQPTPYSSTLTFSLVSGPAPVLQPEITSITYSNPNPAITAVTSNSTIFTISGEDLPIYSSTSGYNLDNPDDYGGADYNNLAFSINNYLPTASEFFGYHGSVNSLTAWGVRIVTSTSTELQFQLAGNPGFSYDPPFYFYLSDSPLTSSSQPLYTLN